MLAPAVLLVDDDESTVELVAHVLRAKGYRILQAKDANEALDAAAAYDGNIPLLVTDLAMPGVNGVELAKRIRRERPETKILYITAYGHLFNAGRHALLAKPFTPDQLLRMVREVQSPPVDRSVKKPRRPSASRADRPDVV